MAVVYMADTTAVDIVHDIRVLQKQRSTVLCTPSSLDVLEVADLPQDDTIGDLIHVLNNYPNADAAVTRRAIQVLAGDPEADV